jgi:hypothetical protein
MKAYVLACAPKSTTATTTVQISTQVDHEPFMSQTTEKGNALATTFANAIWAAQRNSIRYEIRYVFYFFGGKSDKEHLGEFFYCWSFSLENLRHTKRVLSHGDV